LTDELLLTVWVDVCVADIASVQDLMHICKNCAQSLNISSSSSFEKAEERLQCVLPT